MSTTAPGLSFSEYDPGCETVIQGGIAEADLLGVFGREGVYSATAWPLKSIASGGKLTSYLVAAYDLYRNYDGQGAVVGDTTTYAQTSDVDSTSVYPRSPTPAIPARSNWSRSTRTPRRSRPRSRSRRRWR